MTDNLSELETTNIKIKTHQKCRAISELPSLIPPEILAGKIFSYPTPVDFVVFSYMYLKYHRMNFSFSPLKITKSAKISVHEYFL